MVYIKVGNKYADGCFNHLEMFLRIIDNELSQVSKNIKKSADPDSERLCDQGEYLIGYGFVAMQRYIVSTYPQTAHNKGDIFKIGAKLNDKLFLIQIINAGANYWKHEPEWPFGVEYGQTDKDGMTSISVNRSGANLNNQQKNTFDTITQITPYACYTLSNLLAEILEQIAPNSEFSFSPILPFIEEWRNALDKSLVINTDHPI